MSYVRATSLIAAFAMTTVFSTACSAAQHSSTPRSWCEDVPHDLAVDWDQTGSEEVANFATNRVINIRSANGRDGGGDWLRIDFTRADGSSGSTPLHFMSGATVEGKVVTVVGHHAHIESTTAHFLLCVKVVNPQ